MNKSVILEQSLVFHKIKNETGTSSEAAPYLGVLELRGVVPHEDYVAEIIADGCSASAETIDLVLKSADAVTRECVGDHGYKVHTGVSLVMPHLSGSLPSPDAAATDANELVPRIDLGDDLRLAAADLVPKENREDISRLGGVRILSVFTEGIGFSQLKGLLPFSIAGVGFKPTAASSAAVKVVNLRTGTETAAREVTVADNQHIVAQLGAVLAKGDYKVVVTVTDESVAGNRDASYNVKMLSAPAPEPEPIAETPDGQVKVMSATDGGQGGTFTFGHEWKIGGVNMFDGAHRPADIDWTLSEVGIQLGEDDYHILYATYAADGTLITVDSSGASTTPAPGTYDNAKICIMAQKTGEENPISLNIPVRIVVEG